MPSLTRPFYICEYLDVTPLRIFRWGNGYPSDLNEIVEDLRHLNRSYLQSIGSIIKVAADELVSTNFFCRRPSCCSMLPHYPSLQIRPPSHSLSTVPVLPSSVLLHPLALTAGRKFSRKPLHGFIQIDLHPFINAKRAYTAHGVPLFRHFIRGGIFALTANCSLVLMVVYFRIARRDNQVSVLLRF